MTSSSTSNARLESKLNVIIAEVRAGKRERSVVSNDDVDTISCTNQTMWEELRRDLQDVGISHTVIVEKKEHIIAWFQDAVAAGKLEEDGSGEEDMGSDSGLCDNIDSPGCERMDRESRSGNEHDQPLVEIDRGAALHNDTSPRLDAQSPRGDEMSSDIGSYAGSNPMYERTGEEPFLPAEPVELTIGNNSNTSPHCRLHSTLRTQTRLEGNENDRSPRKVRFLEPPDPACNSHFQSGKQMPRLQISKFLDRLRLRDRRLIKAAEVGNVETLRKLLKKGGDIETRDTGEKDGRGETMLQLASLRGHEAAVLFLLDQGADVDAIDDCGYTALHYVVEHRQGAILRCLLERGADVDIRNNLGETPLHLSTRKGDKVLTQLLLKYGANANSRIKYTHLTPLHLAVAIEGKPKWENVKMQEDFIRMLMENSADAEAQDRSGKTPWAIARNTGQDRIVQLILAVRYTC